MSNRLNLTEANPLMIRNRPVVRLSLVAAALAGATLLISASVSAEPTSPAAASQPALADSATTAPATNPVRQVRVIPLWKATAPAPGL